MDGDCVWIWVIDEGDALVQLIFWQFDPMQVILTHILILQFGPTQFCYWWNPIVYDCDKLIIRHIYKQYVILEVILILIKNNIYKI
jgi:hypothetical protein